eukprot:643155-Prorocentrum_lima.AAC.1
METARKFLELGDNEEPIDDDDLISQEYIPSISEADRLGRSGPGHGSGVGPHAAGVQPEQRVAMENARKRRQATRRR